VWEEEDYAQLKNLVHQTGIYIIADEVYEQLVFDNKKHISIWQYPELHNRSFVVFSFGKVFSNTGWKIGYVIAPKALTEGFRSIHQFLVFSVNTPAQYALAKYLQEDRPHNLSQLMQAKRDLFLEAIKDVPFTITQPTSGSYFQLAGYEAISQLPDREFAEWLTIHCGVAVIPVSVFYSDHQDHKLVRFCIAKKDSTLLEAAHRIKTNLT
jgi:methionine aminotransferase